MDDMNDNTEEDLENYADQIINPYNNRMRIVHQPGIGLQLIQ